jgi:metallo-beta-lactamase class B
MNSAICRQLISGCAGALLAGVNLSAANPAQALAAPPDRAWVRNLFAAMKTPVQPRHLAGEIYYVGTAGVSAFLIVTPEGHILLDTGFEDTVPLVRRSVEQLGFKLADIKLILSSHAHIDHVGGHALMKQLTGAQVCASAADAQVLESGGAADFIPFPKDTVAFTPVKVDRIVEDGDEVTLGGVTLKAQLTPGHTRGATTWTMDTTVDGRKCQVVFFSSTTINPGTRLLRGAPYEGIVADYETTFARLKTLPCDIFFAPHGGQFAMADKFARLDRAEGSNPFIDPAGWQQLLNTVEKTYRDQLAAERALAPQ